MPLIRISLQKGKDKIYKEKLAHGVYTALREIFTIPEDDLFVMIHEHEQDNFFYGKHYLNINRTDDLVIIQITANLGRSTELKKALFARIAQLLNENIHIRTEDVFINLIETLRENWSFGNGIAQYAS